MKKTTLFSAMFALLAIASCQKEETSSLNSAKDPVFTAIIENGDAKTTVDAATKKVAWVIGDEITVTDASEISVIYTVTEINNEGVATFNKKSGESKTLGNGPYTAVYGTAPSPSDPQNYSTSASKLPMTGVSGESDFNLRFTVSCGLLEITLTQTGESIKSISVSDNATKPNTYTLNCGTGVSIEGGAKFYIAVPEGTYTSFTFKNASFIVSPRNGLSISVLANHIIPIKSSFAPNYKEGDYSALGIYVAGKWWAPVNCGYDATDYQYGKLYQWGRAKGCGYNDDVTYEEYLIQSYSDDPATSNEPEDELFYKGDDEYNDWYTSHNLPKWPMKLGDTGYLEGKIDNPCPAGWRVPTGEELDNLAGGKGTGYPELGSEGWDSEKSGYWFNGTSSPEIGKGVFLPAAGFRNCDGGNAMHRGDSGKYWSSSVDGDGARRLIFSSDEARSGSNERAFGFSVRCVKE